MPNNTIKKLKTCQKLQRTVCDKKRVPNQKKSQRLLFASPVPHIISSSEEEEPIPSRHQKKIFIREGINDVKWNNYHWYKYKNLPLRRGKSPLRDLHDRNWYTISSSSILANTSHSIWNLFILFFYNIWNEIDNYIKLSSTIPLVYDWIHIHTLLQSWD